MKSYRLHSIDRCFTHLHKLYPLYKSFGPKNSSRVIWSHWDQKVIFTKIALSPTDHHSIDMRPMHMQKLYPLYKSYGPLNLSRVKRSFLLKNLMTCLCCMVWPWNSCMCISLRPSTRVMGSHVNLGSFEVTWIKRLFSLKCCILSMVHSMTIRLIYVDQLEVIYQCVYRPIFLWLHVNLDH